MARTQVVKRSSTPKEPLHIRLRPRKISDVLGQPGIVRSLESKNGIANAYLLHGPSGVGKTTVARIIGRMLGCDKHNILEIDAASQSGVDASRELVNMAGYAAIGNNINRLIIIDECHALSKAAWQSLLKEIEEPRANTHWCLCTTEIDKVPDTIRTRCVAYQFRPIPDDDLIEYIERVIKQERLDITDHALNAIIKGSHGSVRQALVYLDSVNGVDADDEVDQLLANVEEKKEIIDFVRYLAFQRPDWEGAKVMIRKMKDAGHNPESIRIVMVNYIAACLLGNIKSNHMANLFRLLDLFSSPFNASEKYAPLVLVTGMFIMNRE